VRVPLLRILITFGGSVETVMCTVTRATAPAQLKGIVLAILVFCNVLIACDRAHVQLCVYNTARYLSLGLEAYESFPI